MTRPPPVPTYDPADGGGQSLRSLAGGGKGLGCLWKVQDTKAKKVGYGCKHTIKNLLFVDQNKLPTSFFSFWEDPSIALMAGV
jgi:hypothetical protein